MKIIQEASVYDDEKLVDDVEDASKVATNFLTEITSDGVFVHEEGVTDPTASGANGVHISDTVKIIRDGDAVAEYGDAAVIGKADESRAYIDYHSFQMIDKDESEYAHISDIRDESGVATVTERFEGDGGYTYTLQVEAISIDSVTVNGTARTDYTFQNSNEITFNSAISGGSEILVTYKTTEPIYAYTFGTRDATKTIGNASFAHGILCAAEGPVSHAEGFKTRASAAGSHAEGQTTKATSVAGHAEGYGTEASGYGGFSHAEGFYTVASGTASHAQNWNTIAASDLQTAIGKYNTEDTNGTYAFMIGNGTSDNSRSNAMTVDWAGNIKSSGFIVPCMIKTSWSNQTCTGSARATISGLTVPNLPSSATVLGVTVMTTPNDHWIKAYGYVGSNNTIGINYHNESSNSITGAFSTLIFFTL